MRREILVAGRLYPNPFPFKHLSHYSLWEHDEFPFVEHGRRRPIFQQSRSQVDCHHCFCIYPFEIRGHFFA